MGDLKLKLSNYIVFDCETGGLDKKNNCHAINHPITSISLIVLRADNLNEIDRLNIYIKGKYNEEGVYVGYHEGMVYQQQALDFTKITIEKLEKEGVHHSEACQMISEFLKNANTGSHFNKPILVGHNVTYDIPFLQMLFHINKPPFTLEQCLSGYKDHLGNFHPNYLCTMWLSRMKFAQEDTKHNLTALCNHLNVDLYDAHTSLEDTIATGEAFRRLTLDIRTEGENKGENVGKFRDNFTFEM